MTATRHEPSWPRSMYWVFRRELHGMWRAPIVYVVGGLFLVLQGVVFAGLVGQLSDLRRPAPLGALLENQLAGTLLTWMCSLVVLTLLGMRTIAEDKRTGAWELLVTASVSETAAVIGKWLAAAVLYAVLWIPTLAYLAVIAVFRVDSGGWDLATIAIGYLGAIAIGAALLAWAVAASAAMSSSLGAGGLGFALLAGWFMIGEVAALAPNLPIDHPAIAAVLARMSVRATVAGFARGELALDALAFVAGLAMTGLSLASAAACGGRRHSGEVRRRAIGTVLIATIATLAIVIATQHPARFDASEQRRNSLDPVTISTLRELGPATVTIVRPTFGSLEPLYDEVALIASRMAEATTQMTVRRVDPVDVPLNALARTAGLTVDNLKGGGSVIVETAGRTSVVDVLQLATFDRDAPTIERLSIEQALAGALAGLTARQPITACASTGHGELSLTAKDDTGSTDWMVVAARLRADGITIEELPDPAVIPARCSAVIVAGPSSALPAEAALALQRHVAAGHGVVIAAASRSVDGGVSPTGLEGMLAGEQLGLPPAIAIDPVLSVAELPGALLIADGYADHPINAGFARARGTLWFQPRVVVAGAGATPLVSATATSWGERDLMAAPTQGTEDLAGPVALAALGSSGRVVAIGSAESLSSAMLSGGASALDLWFANAVRFVAGRTEPRVEIAARTPNQVRLVMTDAQRVVVIALCAAGIPLTWLLVGGGLVWWRRRRAA
ncbi:MAG: Gldg family protein [Kofleriaceae bacterium]